MRVRSNVNAQAYHSNHYILKLPRNIEKLVFHCSASIASLVQISHSTVRPELSRPCLVLLCTGNWLLLIPHVDQGFTAHLADGNAGSAEDTARLTD